MVGSSSVAEGIRDFIGSFLGRIAILIALDKLTGL